MIEGRVEGLTRAQKYAYLREFGDSPAAYLTTQDGLMEFHIPDVGYASFARFLGANLVLGKPVCAHEELRSFLHKMFKKVRKPTFIQIPADFAQLLSEEYGYAINSFGIETQLPLQTYTLTGNKKNNLRYAIRQGKKCARIHELTMGELRDAFGINVPDLERVRDEWMETRKSRHQLKFLNRSVIFEDEPGVRKFFAIDENSKLLGYVFFSPLYRSGKLIGYYNDLAAASVAAPTGLVTSISLHGMERFRAENLSVLSLGLSPLANLGQGEDMPTESKAVWAGLHFFYEKANHLYNYKGSFEHRRRYRGEETISYIATNWHLKWLELTAMSYYIGILHMKNMPGIKQIADVLRTRTKDSDARNV